MSKYSTIFLFPSALGFLFATALRRAGKKALVISRPSAKADPMPDIVGAAVYIPDIFVQDMAYFGLPEPAIDPRRPYSLNIAGREVLIEPDKARQMLAYAHAIPDLDRQLMRLVERLDAASERMMPKLRASYQASPGKRSLGHRLAKRSRLFPFRSDPLNQLQRNTDGDIARWALHLPAYLSLGIQGADGGFKGIAAGYGLRSPYISSLNIAKLAVEAEHLYLGEGCDVIEANDRSEIALNFAGGANSAEIDGAEVVFDKIFIGKDIAAHTLSKNGPVAPRLHGLTSLSQSFTWTPPRGRGLSAPRDGVIVMDINRPPINDNLVMYSINPAMEFSTVTAAIALERDETMSEHFVQRRRGHLLGRMVSNFAAVMGGKAEIAALSAAKTYPSIKVTGRAKFRLLDDSVTPGCTIEDVVRYARWLSLRSEFSL